METELFNIIITEVLPIVIIIIVVIMLLINYRTTALKRQVTDLRIRLLLNQREQTIRHQLLLEQIKQESSKPHALDELQQIFGDKIANLRHQYPALTDLDIQVLILIGLGVENHEILEFTDMSKRTYYKRRQLIAQRMNTTAAQLDELAKQLFTSNIQDL